MAATPWGIHPDEISAERLPRARVGGYAAEPTEDLLQQVSWALRKALHEHGFLLEEVGRLQARVAELERAGEDLQTEIAASEGRAERVAGMLNAAGRAARETREGARRDAELVLKKARNRAEKFEKELAKARAATSAELNEFASHRQRIQEELRDYLESALAAVNEEREANGQEPRQERLPGDDLLESLVTAARPNTGGQEKGRPQEDDLSERELTTAAPSVPAPTSPAPAVKRTTPRRPWPGMKPPTDAR